MFLNVFGLHQNLRLLCLFYIFMSLINTSIEIRCGKYGFVCINNKYFKKCDDKFARESGQEIIFKCPANTFCNERYKRACDASKEELDNKLHKEIYEVEPGAEVTKESNSIIESEIGNSQNESIPILEKHYKPYVDSDTIIINPSKIHQRFKRKFYCPTEGAFPNRNNGHCFYICYRNQRSDDKTLQALPVCCPGRMVFNPATKQCIPNTSNMLRVEKRTFIYKFPNH